MEGIVIKWSFSRLSLWSIPWHFKINEDIITKLKWQGLQIIKINRKKWWDWHYSFLLSRPHEHGHFWPFFTVQRSGIEQTKTLLFILKVLRCSSNLIQITPHYLRSKMTIITHSAFYLWNYLSEIQIQKVWPDILTIMKDLDNTSKWQVKQNFANLKGGQLKYMSYLVGYIDGKC